MRDRSQRIEHIAGADIRRRELIVGADIAARFRRERVRELEEIDVEAREVVVVHRGERHVSPERGTKHGVQHAAVERQEPRADGERGFRGIDGGGLRENLPCWRARERAPEIKRRAVRKIDAHGVLRRRVRLEAKGSGGRGVRRITPARNDDGLNSRHGVVIDGGGRGCLGAIDVARGRDGREIDGALRPPPLEIERNRVDAERERADSADGDDRAHDRDAGALIANETAEAPKHHSAPRHLSSRHGG